MADLIAVWCVVHSAAERSKTPALDCDETSAGLNLGWSPANFVTSFTASLNKISRFVLYVRGYSRIVRLCLPV